MGTRSDFDHEKSDNFRKWNAPIQIFHYYLQKFNSILIFDRIGFSSHVGCLEVDCLNYLEILEPGEKLWLIRLEFFMLSTFTK